MDGQALRNFFKFDDTDLAANRNGEFSENQKKNLIKEYKANTNFGLKLGYLRLPFP
jgi:hypothetical protein